jgi:hypothetical protein
MTFPNQAPDSSVDGILQPTQPDPPYQIQPGQSLEDYLQQFIAGVTNLNPTSIRPRWQLEPANLPDLDTNWAACGILTQKPIGPYSAAIHDPTGDGYDELQRHEEIDYLVSFYGPDSTAHALNLADGLKIWQNVSGLCLVGLSFIECRSTLRVPELIKEQWVERIDQRLIFRRIIRRNYPILNVLLATGTIETDGPAQFSQGFSVP